MIILISNLPRLFPEKYDPQEGRVLWILYSCVYAAYGMPSHDLINILGRCFEQYHHQESNDGHSLSRLGLFFFARCDIEHQPKNRNILFLKIIRKKFSLKIALDSNGKIFIMEMLECGTKMMLILLLLRKHSRIAFLLLLLVPDSYQESFNYR